jgi:hypothetical protein
LCVTTREGMNFMQRGLAALCLCTKWGTPWILSGNKIHEKLFHYFSVENGKLYCKEQNLKLLRKLEIRFEIGGSRRCATFTARV